MAQSGLKAEAIGMGLSEGGWEAQARVETFSHSTQRAPCEYLK